MALRMAVPILTLLAAWPADPDFAGAWKLKQERRESGSIPAPASAMKIEARAGVFAITESLPGGGQLAWSVGTSGKETKSTPGGLVLKAIGKWEAGALLISTIVMGPAGDYTVMDRWDLSRDGATLTIRREVVRRTGGAESVLTYEREK
jgi:hypothetical protein